MLRWRCLGPCTWLRPANIRKDRSSRNSPPYRKAARIASAATFIRRRQSITANAESSCSNDPWIRFSADAASALSAHGALLLGEMHDNPAHHLLQAAAVTQFANGGTKDAAAIVFEQIRDDQQAALDRFADFNQSAARLATAGDLKRFVEWDKSGWPKDIYDPLFKDVIVAKLAIYPGDVPRDAIMKTAKEGEGSLPAAERNRLGLNIPLGDTLDAASLKEIGDAHCGAMPELAFGGMAYAQRYRDAHLADAVLKASNQHGGAFLIAGGTHVRTDRGVPWYLRLRAPGKNARVADVRRGRGRQR